MPYYSWGEQIGNSFMNMYAQNQQKRLEDARMALEKQKIDISNKQFQEENAYRQKTLDESIATRLQTGNYQNAVLAQTGRQYETENSQWDKTYNTGVDQWNKTYSQTETDNQRNYDLALKNYGLTERQVDDSMLTNKYQRQALINQLDADKRKQDFYSGQFIDTDINMNGIIDTNEHVPLEWAKDVEQFGGKHVSFPTLNSDTGAVTYTDKYLRGTDIDLQRGLNSDANSLLGAAYSVKSEATQRALDRATSSANARISANNNRSVERVGIIDSLDAEIEQMILANPDGWGQDADNRKKATDMLMYKYGSDPATEYYIRSKLYQLKKSTVSSKTTPKIEAAKNGFTGDYKKPATKEPSLKPATTNKGGSIWSW